MRIVWKDDAPRQSLCELALLLAFVDDAQLVHLSDDAGRTAIASSYYCDHTDTDCPYIQSNEIPKILTLKQSGIVDLIRVDVNAIFHSME